MKKIIAFDLDDTLAVSKSAISSQMAQLIPELLSRYDVCIISGGRYEQFQSQVIDQLDTDSNLLAKLHMMPTCGTRYYTYDSSVESWKLHYKEDFTEEQKQTIIHELERSARELNLWEDSPDGEIIEDRLSQITYSALGQKAAAARKYAWADKNINSRQAMRDDVAKHLPDFEVRLGGTTSIDITRTGIDKAYGMVKLIEATGVQKSEILFIGDKLEDGGNDFPVKAFGIDCIAVERWEDTAFVIKGILAVSE